MLVMCTLPSSCRTWPIAQGHLMLMMRALISSSATWLSAQGQLMLMMRTLLSSSGTFFCPRAADAYDVHSSLLM